MERGALDRHIRNVRNFWIEAEIDGRRTPIAGGPVGRNGGFALRTYQRDRGVPRLAMVLIGFAAGENLRLVNATHITNEDVRVFSVVTRR